MGRQADITSARGEKFLNYYSGKVSGELLILKLWQILDEGENIYNTCDSFIEAGDWITWILTGKEVISACGARYKA